MSILAAIRREEKKVKKQLARLQIDLIGLQSAAKALGKSANKDLTKAKKRVRRVLSAAGRAKISRAAKKRWAKIRAQAKKAVA
jgi:phage-related minor tail protein